MNGSKDEGSRSQSPGRGGQADWSSANTSLRPMTPEHLMRRLTEAGWVIEPGKTGGLRMRLSAWRRQSGLGCFLFALLLFLGFAAHVCWMAGGVEAWQQPAGLWGAATLAALSVIALAAAVALFDIVSVWLGRVEWEVGADRLVVRRRLLLWYSEREYEGGELVIETVYHGSPNPVRQLAVKAGGRKHRLPISAPALIVFSSPADLEGAREEIEDVAALVAYHTGWPVVSREAELAEAARQAKQLGKLPAELLKRGFRADLDSRLRTRIRTPVRSQLVAGAVIGGFGAAGLIFAGYLFGTYVQQGAAGDPFLVRLLFSVCLLFPAAFAALFAFAGLAALFGRQHWVLEHNLLIVRSRLFGWSKEELYTDNVLFLALVQTETGRDPDGYQSYEWKWQLQLRNKAGQVLETLYAATDDRVPRLLAAVLADHTGWPLREATEALKATETLEGRVMQAMRDERKQELLSGPAKPSEKGLPSAAMGSVELEAARIVESLDPREPDADHLVVVQAGEEDAWMWHLQLCNQAGDVVRVLRREPNEHVARLLATIIAARTGLPVRAEAQGGSNAGDRAQDDQE